MSGNYNQILKINQAKTLFQGGLMHKKLVLLDALFIFSVKD
ncbi:hypothetical protein HPHPH36_1208 [Helicobacter pylori Hp H-36]|nr:hypothetical protein HPHPH36_1208 [Helicobacter pylori Hp H-36]